MRQLSTKVQTNLMKAIIVNRMAFKNEKIPKGLVGYIKPLHEQYETIQLTKQTA